jgi:hypothetical protein
MSPKNHCVKIRHMILHQRHSIGHHWRNHCQRWEFLLVQCLLSRFQLLFLGFPLFLSSFQFDLRLALPDHRAIQGRWFGRKLLLGSSKGGLCRKKILIQSSFSLLRSSKRLIGSSSSGIFLSQRLVNNQSSSFLFVECLLGYLQFSSQGYKNKNDIVSKKVRSLK